MIKLFVFGLAFYALPYLAYLLGFWLMQTLGRVWWHRHPWFYLALCGLLVAFIGTFYWVGNEGAPPGSQYVAPAYVDGELKPGYFILPDGSQQK